MKRNSVIAWLPIAILPAVVVLFPPEDWPRWAFMWLFAFTIYVGCKWLTWWSTPTRGASIARQLGYLTLWPGLDADAFLHTPNLRTPALSAWCFALAKFTAGVVLIGIITPNIPRKYELIRGWIGMIGVVFVLHFGLFDLLSLAWQTLGVTAKPLMNWPMRATSVSDFWGGRWNTAFRDLTHRFLFRPLTARCGARIALFVGFLFSGIVHDLVISLPAGGGYGGPTMFFLLQGGAIFVERSSFGKRLGLGQGVRGWAFAMLTLVGPLFLLFHPPFVHHVMTPFLDAIAHAFA
jgi:alginate O-acetyltransferase complex protein AlgI